jgi:L-aspartate oxidase
LAKYLNELPEKNRQEPIHMESTAMQPSNYVPMPEKGKLRAEMMAKAGIVRTKTEIQQLANWLDNYEKWYFANLQLDEWSIAQIQRLFMLQVAKLITTGALLREESRGAHNREEYPYEDERWAKFHFVQSKKGIEMRERQYEHNQVEIHA